MSLASELETFHNEAPRPARHTLEHSQVRTQEHTLAHTLRIETAALVGLLGADFELSRKKNRRQQRQQLPWLQPGARSLRLVWR